MRKLILTLLMTAVAVPTMAIPTAASAQSRGEIRRDRQDVREEQRELRDARRYGDRRDIREERRDVREARQELREDLRDRNRRFGNDDWRGYRDRNRGAFARGNWNAPFRYNSFRDGGRIGAGFYGQRYWIADPWRYRLPAVGPNQRWVRHYNDVILVNVRRGQVIRVLRNFYR